MNRQEESKERFLSVAEVAQLFRRDTAWVYRHRHGLLRPAVRKFGPKLLLFDKAELEHIIQRAADDAS